MQKTDIKKSITPKPVLRAAGRTVLDALYPRRCPICERIVDTGPGGGLVCPSCRAGLPYVREPSCRRCGKPIADERRELCADCELHRHRFREGRAAFVYEGSLREAVVRMKFQNRRDYIPWFAEELVSAVSPFLHRIRPELIVPVPMHPRKKAQRGFDQCALLAARTAQLTGIPMRDDLLIRIRYTSPQKGLSRDERRDNLHGAFEAVRPDMLQGRILVIDDIYTTGSTIDELAGTVLRCGNDQVWFAALCTGSDAER